MKINQDSNNAREEKTLILKRNDLIINEKQCQVVNFIDVTAFIKLKQERESNELLKQLNTTVHHEMLAPLRANVDICQRLLRKLRSNEEAKKLV